MSMKKRGAPNIGSQNVQTLYENKAGGIHNDVAANKAGKTVPDDTPGNTRSS